MPRRRHSRAAPIGYSSPRKISINYTDVIPPAPPPFLPTRTTWLCFRRPGPGRADAATGESRHKELDGPVDDVAVQRVLALEDDLLAPAKVEQDQQGVGRMEHYPEVGLGAALDVLLVVDRDRRVRPDRVALRGVGIIARETKVG